ncbi:stage III sporulation protein AF [Clostridium ganghwense]|uniref:Stage III sporulation protein AF n=1 Tax=Clostridium ganghwense TaxID=312089 RepID=A0ABT4CQP8_9CLOT|nr:stage III sporulation protein AF [Clostridium ganghwense]MCY6370319.1 stage III sporulation protein AF [Clostridium ganghwense]
MLEHLKIWIINICTAVFFITAVEMILPNNKIKKYAKFVLGLILITVIINPIIKIFDKNFDMDTYVNSASKYFEEKEYTKDYDKYKTSSIDNTINVFSTNLEKLCIKKLKEKFPKDNYEVLVDVSYNMEEENFIINAINVGVTEGKIKKIKKIEIKDSKEVGGSEIEDHKKSDMIKEYLSGILDISKDDIKIYKM